MSSRTFLCLLVLVSLTGCRVETDEGSLADSISQLPFPKEQRERARVIADFDKDGPTAARKYKELWWARVGERRAQTREERVVLVTIAGELLLRDQASYPRYYSYVIESTKHRDVEVVIAALWALGHTRDGDSRTVLFSFLEDARGEVSRAATESLQYRYAVQASEHMVDADKAAIEDMYERTCGSANRNLELCVQGLTRKR